MGEVRELSTEFVAAGSVDSAELATAAKPEARPRRRRSGFYVGIALLLLAYVIAGFWPKYFGGIIDPSITPPHPGWIIHAHAAVFLGWMMLLVVQTSLVERGRTDLHLKLGLVGAVYGALIIIFGFWASIMLEVHRYSFTHDLGLSAARLLISFETVILFAVFFVAAIWYRRKPEIHKRLMVVATFSLAAPGISRVLFLVLHLPNNKLLIQSVFLVPLYICLAWDWKTHGRIHPAYILGIAGNLALFNSGFIAGSEIWQNFARGVLQSFL